MQKGQTVIKLENHCNRRRCLLRCVVIPGDRTDFHDIVFAQLLAGLQPAQSVLILGSGISGLLHLMLAKALGAGRIVTTDISEHRLRAAMSLGADAAIHASEDVPARFRALNGGRPADLVIVCAGALSAYRQALLSVDRGGTILCFAPTDPDIELPVPVNDFWRNEIRVLPSYGNAPHDAAVAIELIRSGRVPVEKMITHRLSLAEAGLGFRLVAEAGEAIKVILYPFGPEGRVHALQYLDLNLRQR